jgi:glycosyltransferase involved in cell wall biosynthesis
MSMLSIIIPVLNEAESLPELSAQISAVCSQHALDAEVIFVDDGSTDGSWEVIRDLSGKDERVSGIRFRRNFGKAAALSAGMRAARGETLLTMDADLQDDPAEIPRLQAKLEEGYDVVNGWKQRRLDPWHKVYPSKVFNWLVARLTGLKLHDHNCGLKLFRAEVAREVRLYGELHRFVPVLAHARRLQVRHPPVPARLPRPADGHVSDRLRPASAAPAGGCGTAIAPARHGRAGLPGAVVAIDARGSRTRSRADRRPAAAGVFRGRAAAGRAGAVAGPPGRTRGGLHGARGGYL